ncbi:MAG: efflux RND transporter periplasmic adaptor subunit, partial [Terriglobales bacterium]
MSRARKFKWSVAAVALLATLAAAGCGGNRQQSGPQAGMGGPVPVKVKTVSDQKVGDFTEYLATLISRNSAMLQPDVEGQVTRIFVHSGQHVERGTPLLEINPQKQQATVQSTQAQQRANQANLALAKQNLERTQGLYKEGIIARQALDQAQAAYDAALATVNANRASVAEQQAQLHYYTVRAPETGIVGDIPVHVGDHVTTSTQLTSVVTPGPLEAYIYVPAENAALAKDGLKVTISTDDNLPPVTTKVDFVSPRVDPQSQLLLLKAQVPNPNGRFRNEEEVHARVYW